MLGTGDNPLGSFRDARTPSTQKPAKLEKPTPEVPSNTAGSSESAWFPAASSDSAWLFGETKRKRIDVTGFKRWMRRISRQYNVHRGELFASFQLRGTAFEYVVCSKDFRNLLIVHFVIKFAYIVRIIPRDANKKTSAWYLGWTSPNLLILFALFSVFFLAYLTIETYKAYEKLHLRCMKIMRGLVRVSFLIHRYLGRDLPKYEFLADRYLLASVIVFFESEDAVDEQVKGFLTDQVLSEEELEYLRPFDPSHRPLLLLQWSNDVLIEACSKVFKQQDQGQHEFLLFSEIMKVYKYQMSLTYLHELPLPFQYRHLINVTICGILLLIAYACAISDSLLSSSVFVSCTALFMAGVHVSQSLMRPFGSDSIRFPVKHWLVECWGHIRCIQMGEFLDARLNQLLRREDDLQFLDEDELHIPVMREQGYTQLGEEQAQNIPWKWRSKKNMRRMQHITKLTWGQMFCDWCSSSWRSDEPQSREPAVLTLIAATPPDAFDLDHTVKVAQTPGSAYFTKRATVVSTDYGEGLYKVRLQDGTLRWVDQMEMQALTSLPESG